MIKPAVVACAAVVALIAGCATERPASSAPTTSAAPVASAATPSVPSLTSSPSSSPSAPTVTAAPADARVGSAAIAVLADIAVEGRAPKTDYTRAQFGSTWTDDNDDLLGHNGCDTRNDILRRDLTAVVLKLGTHGCTVLSGSLLDPYTGNRIAFQRGAATSARVQIDHVVALSDAWQTGAQYWSAQRRTDFANDPLELLAVDGPTNEAKGDGDAATWLPPNRAYRCAYVARQVAVKARYGLWMTAAEKDATARVLASCPGQRVPTEAGAPPPVAAGAATPHTAPRSTAHSTAKPRPVATVATSAAVGPTALCKDGTYSYAAHHQGACSHHGGVAVFYR